MQVEVVVVGGGPTGMMLAAELALAKVDVALVERRRSQEVEGVRARGLHARTIEVLDLRGIAERFLSQGQKAQVASFGRNLLDLSGFPTRHPYGLALVQAHFERILGEWVSELEVPIYRGQEVTGFTQDETGVDVELADGERMRAQYLVGCDGGRSAVRKQAGIDFVGHDPTVSYLLAEVELTQEPAWGMRQGERGVHGIGKLPDGKGASVVVSERQVERGAPTLEELRKALVAAHGTDFGLRSARYISRFTDMARQAASYRERRVLLAGDAAHVHSPVGGHGLNLGVQDAVNLGWKLGQVVHGVSPHSLLDTYHSERHPVAARVLRNSMAQSVLDRGEPGVEALREHLSALLKMDAPRKRYAAMVSGLDIHYDLGEGHPLLGRRMPDLDLASAAAGAGPTRVYSLLHGARWVLLNLNPHLALTAPPRNERLRVVEARYEGAWELPGMGPVPAPTGVLIRPDGHVAWVGEDGTDRGLEDALARWL